MDLPNDIKQLIFTFCDWKQYYELCVKHGLLLRLKLLDDLPTIEEICKENGIELIKFEDGWKCMEYNSYNENQNLWYLHHREFSVDSFKNWFLNK